MFVQRLRTDFQLAILMVFGVSALVGIAPFMVYRFVHGQPLLGAIDIVLMLCVSLALVHLYRGGNLQRATALVAVTNTVGCIVVGHLVGLPGVFWAFPATLGNFLLLSRGRAVAASAAIVAGLVISGRPFADELQAAVFAVTTVVVSVFAFAFSYRAGLQREQLELLAERDPLTGAYNRRAMERELRIAMEDSRRNHSPVGLAVMDLDHFKRVNDAYGHEAGDRVLVDFATLVTRATRQGDRFFRYGGEEFVLLLPGANAGALATVTEFLRQSGVEQLQCRDLPVTVSVGAATLGDGDDAARWLARADAALYRAKDRGRNRVVLDDGVGAGPEGVVPEPAGGDRRPRRAQCPQTLH